MHALTGLFSFRGTLGRGEYWACLLFGWLVFHSAFSALDLWLPERALIFGQITLAALACWLVLAWSVRRLHDRALSAMCLLAVLIPIVGGVWLLLQLAFLGSGHHTCLANRSALAWRPVAFPD